jgi:hypothetical protein
MHWNFPNTIFLIFIIYGPFILKYLTFHMEFWTNPLHNEYLQNNLLYFWLNVYKKFIIFII